MQPDAPPTKSGRPAISRRFTALSETNSVFGPAGSASSPTAPHGSPAPMAGPCSRWYRTRRRRGVWACFGHKDASLTGGLRPARIGSAIAWPATTGATAAPKSDTTAGRRGRSGRRCRETLNRHRRANHRDRDRDRRRLRPAQTVERVPMRSPMGALWTRAPLRHRVWLPRIGRLRHGTGRPHPNDRMTTAALFASP